MLRVLVLGAVLWTVAGIASPLSAAKCTTAELLKAESDRLDLIWKQAFQSGGSMLTGFKGTQACRDWELAYRAQADVVRVCAAQYREALETADAPAPAPSITFKVAYASYGDIPNDHTCDAAPQLRIKVSECNAKSGGDEQKKAVRHLVGNIHYCTVSFTSNSSTPSDFLGSSMSCGYRPSPYLLSSEQAFDIRLRCDDSTSKLASGEIQFRVPGNTQTITFACMEDAKHVRLVPAIAPGYTTDEAHYHPADSKSYTPGSVAAHAEGAAALQNAVEMQRARNQRAGGGQPMSVRPASANGQTVDCRAPGACGSNPKCRGMAECVVCKAKGACRPGEQPQCEGSAECNRCTSLAACANGVQPQCDGSIACEQCRFVKAACMRLERASGDSDTEGKTLKGGLVQCQSAAACNVCFPEKEGGTVDCNEHPHCQGSPKCKGATAKSLCGE